MYKALYYPQITIHQNVTRFGAIETNYPQLYASPIDKRVICRIDTLESLKDIWGENILMSRELTYSLVSGNCSDEQYHKILQSYYVKFASFTNYVNYTFLFGDTNIPAIKRLIDPIRKIIDDYTEELLEEIKNTGGKFLMRTHDYIYCAYSIKNEPSFDKEVVYIC